MHCTKLEPGNINWLLIMQISFSDVQFRQNADSVLISVCVDFFIGIWNVMITYLFL
jgi:hypothetical protein